jgi:hypothetical protein
MFTITISSCIINIIIMIIIIIITIIIMSTEKKSYRPKIQSKHTRKTHAHAPPALAR